MQKRILIVFAVLSVLTIIFYALILNPTIQESIGWHLNNWIIRVRVWLNPPEEVPFSAESDITPEPGTLPSPDVEITLPTENVPDETPQPTATFAPIPSTFELVRGEYFSQHYRWNYCGPANISMLLSMWGW